MSDRGVHKSIQIRLTKKQKNKNKIEHMKQTPKRRGPMGHGTLWITLVWNPGSLGAEQFQKILTQQCSKLVISPRLWAKARRIIIFMFLLFFMIFQDF